MAHYSGREVTQTAIAPLPPLDIRGAFVRKTDLSHANLSNANLSDADAAGALFVGADFAGADLRGTILIGADLTGAKNLTIRQLQDAVTDGTTKLPSYISHSDIE